MLNVLIADDEPGVLVVMESILSGVKDIILHKAQTSREALDCFLKNKVDVIFLDIGFADGSGIELAKKMMSFDPDITMVFVTGNPKFALDAFEIYSYDYILKPIDEVRVLRTVKRIIKEKTSSLRTKEEKEIPLVALKNGKEIILINSSEILFLERVGNLVKIHSLKGEYETTEPLTNLQQKLKGSFFRSHKSCIVNLKWIDKIVAWNSNTYQIHFKNSKKKADLSRRKAHEIFKVLPLIN